MASVNVYLPDDLAEPAKAADLPFSRMLREAVTDELERRAAVSKTLEEPQEHLVDVENENGNMFKGRITGALIAQDDRRDIEVYLTDDERILAYNGRNYRVTQIEKADLRGWLDDEGYLDAMEALGEEPVIDL